MRTSHLAEHLILSDDAVARPDPHLPNLAVTPLDYELLRHDPNRLTRSSTATIGRLYNATALRHRPTP